MMIKFRAASAVLTALLVATSLGAFSSGTTHAAQAPAAPLSAPVAALPAGMTFYCPMHPELTSPTTTTCPVCKMQMVVGNPLDTREYELDFATTPAAVKAGQPFTLKLRVTDGDEAVTKFEEVHDKRYHLFIISRDMTVFEHVHPVEQPDGTWELGATLPKPGYYNIVSDFLPTGGTPQVLTRELITADYDGDALTDQVKIQPDLVFQKTLNGITATVDFDPKPLQAGEHGHLTYNLTDEHGQPVTDLQPYLGAFGHTLIMSGDQTNVVHSHPTPDLSNDISRGAGGPRVMFEGYFPTAGEYRVWTQFLRHDQITTFSFAFRVPTLEEAMRRTQ
jgi:hypothetical protein